MLLCVHRIDFSAPHIVSPVILQLLVTCIYLYITVQCLLHLYCYAFGATCLHLNSLAFLCTIWHGGSRKYWCAIYVALGLFFVVLYSSQALFCRFLAMSQSFYFLLYYFIVLVFRFICTPFRLHE